MTQEEKVKAYDELLIKAKQIYNKENDVLILHTIEELFPEIKEGGDKRIRKALLGLVHDTTGDELWVDYNVHKEEALAWLEKQGIQNLANSAKTCKDVEQKPADKVVPKFKVGDFVKNVNHHLQPIYKIVGLDKECYICISDDVTLGDNTVKHFTFDNPYLRLVEQNSAWCEEDEKQARQIERIVHNDGCTQKLQKQIADWFKSLKDRVQPQPRQEWSEDDESILNEILKDLMVLKYRDTGEVGKAAYQKEIDWLKTRFKFLRPRSPWKPSEEQDGNVGILYAHSYL